MDASRDDTSHEIAAVAADPNRARWNQQSVSSGELMHVYGFEDIDGSQPDIWPELLLL